MSDKRIMVRIDYEPKTVEDFLRAVAGAAQAAARFPRVGMETAVAEPVAAPPVADEAQPVKVISTEAEAVEAFGEGSDLADLATSVLGDEEPPPPPPAGDDDAPPPPPPATVATVELDAAGLPFDPRIHGSGRAFYASGANKGNWKPKRQVDPELVVKVEAELRAALAVPSPTAEQLETASTGITTLADFITACTTKGLPALEVTEAIKKHGIEGVPVLATRPDLIPLIAAELEL